MPFMSPSQRLNSVHTFLLYFSQTDFNSRTDIDHYHFQSGFRSGMYCPFFLSFSVIFLDDQTYDEEKLKHCYLQLCTLKRIKTVEIDYRFFKYINYIYGNFKRTSFHYNKSITISQGILSFHGSRNRH